MRIVARDDADRSKGGRVDGRLIVGGVLLVGLLVFVFQNTDDAALNFLMFEFTAPLWLMLAITIAVAVGIGFVLGRRRRARD